jgi:phosphodiesterase/alkaline phosphatase D-like protein
LSGLTPDTVYHYRVKSTNRNGQTITSGDYTFTTQPFSSTPTPSPSPSSPPTSFVITNVLATDVAQTTVLISWDLSDYGTGQVEYGTTTAYGSFSNLEPSFDYKHHVQQLSGLTPNTLYYYHVISTNRNGQTITSGDFTFTTLP